METVTVYDTLLFSAGSLFCWLEEQFVDDKEILRCCFHKYTELTTLLPEENVSCTEEALINEHSSFSLFSTPCSNHPPLVRQDSYLHTSTTTRKMR